MAIISFTNVAIPLIALYLVTRIYHTATTGAHRRALSKKNGCLPAPQRQNSIFPSYLSTFGLDFMISQYRTFKAHTLLQSWSAALTKAHSHTIHFTIFGVKDLFLTDEPENVKCMLATNFDAWSLGQDRIDQMSSWLGKGIFTNEGQAWKHSREMLRPCFERSAVADVSLLDKHTTRLLDLPPDDGSEVNLQPLFHELMIDIATEFLFGRSMDMLDRTVERSDVKEFVEALEYAGDPMLNENQERWGWLGLFMRDGKRKRCIKYINEFTEKLIEEELALHEVSTKDKPTTTKDSRYIFLHELFLATQDRTVIRSELLNILLAGRDTTASLLSNLVWELSRQPEMLSRLRFEITEVLGDDDETNTKVPTYDQLKTLKYLRALINESQRLHPIVPANSRSAHHDTILPLGGGPDGTQPLLVPKGSYVMYHTWGMQRRTDIFGKDADVFDPERWLKGDLRPGWGYIPFSGGPRVCIGQNFALTEVMFVVVQLVRRFELVQKDFEAWRERLTIIAVGDGGCKVGLKTRGA